MIKFVVTGGAGFIGSHIVEELLKYNYQVTVVDNLLEGREENIAHVRDKIDFRKADIRDKAALKDAFANADYVLHQAALRSVPKSFDAPADYIDVNIQGTYNVFEIAKEANVKRVIYASSSSVYGNSNSFPQKESDPTKPISPYAITKLNNEHFAKVFSTNFGLFTVGLRYFNVFGPRQDPASQYAAVIAIFCKRMKNGQSPIIHGAGDQSRDFTYVKDVVEANIAACFAPPEANGRAFNVCNGSNISVLNVAQAINKIQKTKILPTFQPRRQGDVDKTHGSNKDMIDICKWKAKYSFEEGLKKTLEYF